MGDFHIDTRLEELFHPADSTDFNLGNGGEDVTVADTLPKWLIGVIVVIILLVIAFFIMVIASIIKNKRKSRSTMCSDRNSISHPCDDLELGKISQVNPMYQGTFVSDGANSRTEMCHDSQEEDFVSSSSRQTETEFSSSSVGNGGTKPLSGCKNPLFIDDCPEEDTEDKVASRNNNKVESMNAKRCGKVKGKFHKNRCSKTKLCNDLDSVDEICDENLTTEKTEHVENASNGVTKEPDENTSNVISNPPDSNANGQVFIHQHLPVHIHSTNSDISSKAMSSFSADPNKVNGEIISSEETGNLNNGIDISQDKEAIVEKNGVDHNPSNTAMALGGSSQGEPDMEVQKTMTKSHGQADTNSDCNSNPETGVKEVATGNNKPSSFVPIDLSDDNNVESHITEDDLSYTKL